MALAHSFKANPHWAPRQKKGVLDFIPGENGLPFVGNTLRLLKDPVGFGRRMAATYGPVYRNNSFGGPKEAPVFREPPLKITGDADRYDHRAGNDDYTQAGDLFRLMSPAQKTALMDNVVASMGGVPEAILRRQITHFTLADPAYGAGVAARLGLEA